MFAVRQKPSRDVNSAQEECGIVGHRGPPGGETMNNTEWKLRCSRMVWKRGGEGGVDERRRSGGEQKTKTLSGVRHVVLRKHERIYRHI